MSSYIYTKYTCVLYELFTGSWPYINISGSNVGHSTKALSGLDIDRLFYLLK